MKTIRIDRDLVALFAAVSLYAAASVASGSEGAGVTDFSGANPAGIQTTDIQEALAVPRGTRIEASTPPTLRLPVFFEFNSARLRPEATELLDKVGAALASDELDVFRFSVEGHTDSVGSESYNGELSRARAAAVRDYLVAKGVPENRLGTVGHGERVPVADNETDDGRQRNRRVELINLGTAQ